MPINNKHLRINFKNTQNAVDKDKRVFIDWCDGIISTGIAAERIARNNGLDYVSQQQFMYEVSQLGWYK